MAFEKLVQLDADENNTYALGGINKKTKKANPKSVEGYYLGHRIVTNKTGPSKLHYFQTEAGAVGIWGKTNLDRQLSDDIVGTMTRVTYTGMKETKNSPMYTYSVEVDRGNTASELSIATGSQEEPAMDDEFSDDEPSDDDGEEDPADETPPVSVTKANKAKALLKKRAA